MNLQPETDELAGDYVLGTLSAARRREVEQRLPFDADLRAAVQRWQEQLLQASSTNQLSLTPLGQAEVPAEKSLQFWTKGDNWNGPVSLGLVKPGQTVRIPLDKLPPLQPNQLFELTLEPVNGSPTNRPTGPIQFIGRAVKVT